MKHEDRFLAWVVGVAMVVIVGVHVWTSVRSADVAGEILDRRAGTAAVALESEKTRAEVTALEIENRKQTLRDLALVSSLVQIGAVLTAFVTIWLAWRRHVGTRERELLDRAAEDLDKALARVSSDHPRKRAMGVVALQHFLTADKREYHFRVLSLLATLARREKDEDVLRGIRTALNAAMGVVDDETFRRVSWDHARLRGVRFA